MKLSMDDIQGHDAAKAAIATAVETRTNVLLIGPPGTGKPMLARRVPSLLPALAPAAEDEITEIYEIAGLERPLWTRPFRAPHHTANKAAIVGTPKRVGEVTLATHGVLFLDEITEFPVGSVLGLESALSEGLPFAVAASPYLIIGSAMPCPCGYRGHDHLSVPQRACRCAPNAIDRHWRRIGDAMLRFRFAAIHVERIRLR